MLHGGRLMKIGNIFLLLFTIILSTVACGKVDNTTVEKGNIGGIYRGMDNEYNKPTGKWFLGGRGNIGFGISAGEMPPKSEVYVTLVAHPVKSVQLDRDIRFQLTKRDRDNQLIEIIKQETIFIDTITTSKKILFSSSIR